MSGSDYYEVLGVDETADAAALRRAFRLRVRDIHPDVAADKAEAHESFLELKEAYAVLSDPDRRSSYDARRRRQRIDDFVPGYTPPPPPSIDFLMQRAREELREGRLKAARKDLVDILTRKPDDAEAMLLMAEVFKAAGNLERRLLLLHAAVEMHPEHRGLRIALNDALQADVKRPAVVPDRTVRKKRSHRAVLWLGMAIAAWVFVQGAREGGPPLWLMGWLVPGVPSALVRGALLAAGLLGLALSASGTVEPVDEVLFYADTYGRSLNARHERRDPLVGLAMPLLALLHYLLAAVLLAAISIGRGVVNASLLAAFALSLGLALLMATVEPDVARSILSWCPGWLLAAYFTGWFLGDLFRP